MLGQHRSTQRYQPKGRADEDLLVADMIELARQYGRYGYRRIAALLRDAGWQISDGRVERLWRREGLKVPAKQPKKGRLWLNDGSCIRLRPERRDHVWSYDFVHCRTDDGKAFRLLNILDEFSRECLTIRVKRKLNANDVIDALSDLFVLRGVPGFIRSDNARSSSPRRSGIGSRRSAPGRPISSRVRLGRMAMWRASTPGSETNSSTARSSTRCAKPRSSSKAGEATTIPSDLTVPSDTDRPHRKPLSPSTKGP